MLIVTPIAILQDNYVWIIEHVERRSAYVIDPGDAAPVIAYLQQRQLAVAGIIITHSHRDHTGGIDALLAYQPAAVYGPDCAAIAQVSHPLYEGDDFLLWDTYRVAVLATPGHLPEHLCYFLQEGQQPWLFCADILFSAGCGRIFIGTHAEMKDSLDRLKQLPPQTQVCCAHEYTQSNLAFAQFIEPDNQAVVSRRQAVDALRADGRPSLPTTIAAELRFNPFLRCHLPAVIKAAEDAAGERLTTELAVFTALRLYKDRF
ncbi:MAG: hydroxyacylglutathione hydrolase [Cellvibrionaceae bacterium]|nr:hydroxyacylglutathione hydrolase [Cellvibrionaceae bacterium]